MRSQSVHSDVQDTSRAGKQPPAHDVLIDTKIEESGSTPPEASQMDLPSILETLGYPGLSLESALARAIQSDRGDNASLLLQLGADPLSVYRTSAISPSVTDIWKSASRGYDYGSLKSLIYRITRAQYVNFASLTWEWDVSASLDIGLDNVTLISWELGKFNNIHAMTCQEYIARTRWSGFVTDLMDLLRLTGVDPENDGQFSSSGITRRWSLSTDTFQASVCALSETRW